METYWAISSGRLIRRKRFRQKWSELKIIRLDEFLNIVKENRQTF
jgi:hypothetical protein